MKEWLILTKEFKKLNKQNQVSIGKIHEYNVLMEKIVNLKRLFISGFTTFFEEDFAFGRENKKTKNHDISLFTMKWSKCKSSPSTTQSGCEMRKIL